MAIFDTLWINVGKGILSVGWLYVLFAAIVEIFWVIGLRYAEGFWQWTGTIVMIVFSFISL